MTPIDPSWLASAGPALLLAAVAGFVAGALLGGPPCGPSPLGAPADATPTALDPGA